MTDTPNTRAAEAPAGAPAEAEDDRPDVGAGGAPEGEGSSGDAGAEPTPSNPQGDADKDEPPTLVVRYGRMRLLGRFRYSLQRWRRGQRAVVKSDRGIEVGTILCRWVAGGGDDLKIRGKVLRLVTHTDEVDQRHLEKDAEREFAFFKERIAARNLPMKPVAVEHLFGGDRIFFYFMAGKRVDFRALVRDLAREYQTRIEMCQIGVRDEARLLGNYERCGRPLCCRAFMQKLETVSMRMAKVQKSTLDPAKISGRCGRLACCLRFEHATYRELRKNLPRKRTVVGTAVGRGKVVDTDVVTQMVTVMLDSGTSVVVPVETLVPPDEAPAPGAVAPVVGEDRHSRDAGGEDANGSASKKKTGDRKGGRGRRSKARRRDRQASKDRKAKSGGGGKGGKKKT